MSSLLMNEFAKYWCYVKSKNEVIEGVWDFPNGITIGGVPVTPGGGGGGIYTAGPGLLLSIGNQFSLDIASTILVSPTITVAWTLTKADTSAYSPSSSSSKNITVDIGVIAAFDATYQYPAASTGQALPISASGDFGTTLPGPSTSSAALIKTGITTGQTDTIILSKPQSGLIVVGSQVQIPSGNDTTQDSISISFSNKLYLGITTKDGSGGNPILDSDILGLSTSIFTNTRIHSFTNVGGSGEYLVINFPTSFGTPTFIVNGLTNTAFTKVRSASNFVNAGGGTIVIDTWISNNTSGSPIASFSIT